MNKVIDPETGQEVSLDGNTQPSGNTQQQQNEPASQVIPNVTMGGVDNYLNHLFAIGEKIRNTPATMLLKQSQQKLLSEDYQSQRAKEFDGYVAQNKLNALMTHVIARGIGAEGLTKEQELPGLLQQQTASQVEENTFKKEEKQREKSALINRREAEDFFLSDAWDKKVHDLEKQYGPDIADHLNTIASAITQRAATGNGNPAEEFQGALKGLMNAYNKKTSQPAEVFRKWNPETNAYDEQPIKNDPVKKYMDRFAKLSEIKTQRELEDQGLFAQKIEEKKLPVDQRIAELSKLPTEDEQLTQDATKIASEQQARDDARLKYELSDLDSQSKFEQDLANKTMLENKNFPALVGALTDENQGQSPSQSTFAPAPDELHGLIDPETGQTISSQATVSNRQPATTSENAPINNQSSQVNPPPKSGLLGNANSIPAFFQGAYNESKDIGRGIGELGYEIGNKLGIVSDNRLNEIYQNVAEQRKTDADLLKEKYGQNNDLATGAGNIATSLISSLLPGSGAMKALEYIPKIGKLSGVLGLASKAAAGGAGSGAAMGLMTPTEGKSSRLDNIETGALTGGLAGGVLGGTLGGVGKLIQAVKPSYRAAQKADLITGDNNADVQRIRKAAEDAGVFAEPSVASGSSVARSTEAESALSKAGLKNVEGKLINRENVLRDNIKNIVSNISNSAEKKAAGELYKEVLPKQVPPDAQKEILSNPMLAKFYDEMHTSDNYNTQNIVQGSFEDFDKLKRVIDGKLNYDVFQAGGKTTEAAKDLKLALDGNPNKGIKGLREILDNIDPNYAKARQLSERGQIQKEMLGMMKDVKIKSSVGETDLFNMYHNMFDTGAKRDYFTGKLNRAGVNTDNINGLLDFIGNVEKSGLYRLIGRQSLNLGRLEGAAGADAMIASSTRNFIKGAYNKEFVNLITDPRWENEVAKINAAKTDQSKLRLLVNSLARISGIEGANK